MRKLVYKFTDGRTVDTYGQATEIAKNENIPFTAEVVPIENKVNVIKVGLREKYREYFFK